MRDSRYKLKVVSPAEIYPCNFSNHYVHTGEFPSNFIENINNPLEGYPKLQRLKELKQKQIQNHATKPYGCRVNPNEIVSTINNWVNVQHLQFDVIMIGALAENQFDYSLLLQLPLQKLCARPGFLFIWASTAKINELTNLLNSDGWGKKFRRSEELVFAPPNKESPYYIPNSYSAHQGGPLFQSHQWHCWMCITGTVRRSTDSHLIHCNTDTDLQIPHPNDTSNRCVPDNLYRVVENFSNSQRRLHILPSSTGSNLTVKVRPGWVILSPDCLLDNFDPVAYQQELIMKSTTMRSSSGLQYLVPQTDEIEELRPKSPPTTK